MPARGSGSETVALLFAVQGLHGLWLLERGRRRAAAEQNAPVWLRRRVATAGALVLLGMVFEVRPETLRLAGGPDARAHAGWIAFVRERTPEGRAVACIPFAAGNRVGDFDVTARWMYYGTYHGAPLVNGYSGFFPDQYFDLRDAVQSAFPAEDVVRRLDGAGVEFVVVMRAAVPAEDLEQGAFASGLLEPVFEDAAGVTVYRVRRHPHGP